MGYGDFERCPLLEVMLPERKERVGLTIGRVMKPDRLVRNGNIIGE